MLETLYVITAILSLIVLTGWRLAKYSERSRWWTFRLRISLIQPYFITTWITSVTIASIASSYVALDDRLDNTSALVFLLVASCGILVLGGEHTLAVLGTRSYLQLRWKAWTGPSRTGIVSAAVQYIGDREDWVSLASLAFKNNVHGHPIERWAAHFAVFAKQAPIASDPTDLLRMWESADREANTVWMPQSPQQLGLFQPILPNESVSLLWGERLGFAKRCSRGFISIPPNLLTASPMLKSGLNGEAVCLAYGILARNKGLEPSTLICNLQSKGSFRQFEEGGLWPHPAKTLRGFYHSEFSSTFSLLGSSYVTAATELALLLADSDMTTVEEWLDSHLEHQDLELNLQVHALGATPDELRRLYRGHYAAMLLSLNLQHRGCRIRPEITVFNAVCRVEGIEPPLWVSSDAISARRKAELDEFGPRLSLLVHALI